MNLLVRAGYRHNPWAHDTYDNLDLSSDIAVIGSRLTAINIVMKLVSLGHRGKIKLFSRSGLLPTVLSKEIPPYHLKYFTLNNLNKLTKNGLKNLELADLLSLFWQEASEAEGRLMTLENIVTSYRDMSPENWLKHEIKSAEAGPRLWQQTLFSLHSITPTIWLMLSLTDQKEFLRNYHSLYLTYLAAFPLDNAYKLLSLLDSGQLTVHSGLKSINYIGNDYFSLFTDDEACYIKLLFNGTGPGYDPNDLLLFRNMRRSGLIKKHHCGGIDVNPAIPAKN